MPLGIDETAAVLAFAACQIGGGIYATSSEFEMTISGVAIENSGAGVSGGGIFVTVGCVARARARACVCVCVCVCVCACVVL